MLSGETGGGANPYGDRPSLARIALVRICSHYFSHGARLEDGMLLRDAHPLAGVPAVLIHGRLDMGGPLVTAWQLHRLGTQATHGHVMEALDGLAAGW